MSGPDLYSKTYFSRSYVMNKIRLLVACRKKVGTPRLRTAYRYSKRSALSYISPFPKRNRQRRQKFANRINETMHRIGCCRHKRCGTSAFPSGQVPGQSIKVEIRKIQF
ncbi:hypothetical protein Adt_05200 [Abeliophyllum distichum]|uniref:Ribosomal protein S14 n=1 Tax=Abeliophyllum distichum TaxID=126358 RepID=A0ABD1V3F2_9LAMI